MNKKQLIIKAIAFCVLAFGLLTVSAQVGIGTTGTVDGSAALEVKSTTKGLLPPRMTTAERTAIATPTNGLVIYNTSTGKLNVYENGAWIEFSTLSSAETFSGVKTFSTSPIFSNGATFSGTTGFVNTTNSGTLAVTGTSSFTGAASFVNTTNSGTLGVTGLASFVNTTNSGTLGVTGATTLSGTSTHTGAATFNGDATFNGNVTVPIAKLHFLLTGGQTTATSTTAGIAGTWTTVKMPTSGSTFGTNTIITSNTTPALTAAVTSNVGTITYGGTTALNLEISAFGTFTQTSTTQTYLIGLFKGGTLINESVCYILPGINATTSYTFNLKAYTTVSSSSDVIDLRVINASGITSRTLTFQSLNITAVGL